MRQTAKFFSLLFNGLNKVLQSGPKTGENSIIFRQCRRLLMLFNDTSIDRSLMVQVIIAAALDLFDFTACWHISNPFKDGDGATITALFNPLFDR